MLKKNVLKFLGLMAILTFGFWGLFPLQNIKPDTVHTSILTDSDRIVPAFDGLAWPIEKMPDWVKLGKDKWNLSYSQIPAEDFIPVASYDPVKLQIPVKNLDVTKTSEKAILNAKAFYLAVYLGNYRVVTSSSPYADLEFDGKENAGSHTGIDMRLPKGTPLHVIGNGKVVQVSFDTIGFGNHIVVQHENFPSLTDPTKKTTYYSTYNHMDSIVVKEGDVVLKGQVIGRSGQSGYATLPHLHFQIDNNQAPWHPYWPFTLKEAEDAGDTYSDAVNNGLGIEKARAVTINPLNYIQKYQNMSGFAGTTVASLPEKPSTTPVQNLHASAPVVKTPTPPSSPEKSTQISANASAKIVAVGKIMPTGSNTAASNPAPSSNEWKTLTSSLSSLILNRPFADVPVKGELTTALNFLKTYQVVSGYSNGFFRPSSVVSRAEAPKLILASINVVPFPSKTAPFSDVPAKAWYAGYVSVAKTLGIVKGYSKNAYKPQFNVSRAEFLKMLLQAWKIKLSKVSTVSIMSDVDSSHWVATYVQAAKMKGLIDARSRFFRPDQAITRGEAAVFLYRMIQVQLSGQKSYNPTLVVTADKAEKYFQ